MYWGIYYGTVSTTNAIAGSQSIQCRYYSSATSVQPYAQMQFDVENVKSISFKSKVSNANLYLQLQYSTDEGSTWVNAQSYDLTTTTQTYSYNTTTKLEKARFKFLVKHKNTLSSGNQQFFLDDVSIKGESSSSQLISTTVTIDASQITNTDVYTATAAGSLSAMVTAGGSVISSADVNWSSSDTGVATIDANGAVTLVSAGTTTITASFSGDAAYAPSSATYELTVTDSTPFEGGDITFDASIDVGNNDSGSGSITKQEITLSGTNCNLSDGAVYRLYASSTTTISLSQNVISSGYKIKSIVFTDESGYEVSNFANPTIVPSVSNGGVSNWDYNNKTWIGEATSVSFKAGKQVRVSQIVVTVEKPKTLSSIAITTPPTKTTYNEGETFDPTGMVVTATYTDETTAPVTGYTFTPDGALATTDTQVTISYPLNDVTKTATQAITVNALPTHTVTFSVNGRTSTADVKEGNAINFPTVTGTSILSYVGWTTDAINGTTNDAPEILVTSATMGTADITYYAVYAKTSVTERTGTYTLDYDNEELSETSGWGTYGTALEYTASDGGEWVIKAYKNNGMQINTSRNASIKVPTCPGNIQSIEITGSAAKAVGFSANDYTGSGTITYLAEGTDATSQTLNLASQNVTTGYIVPKSGNISITNIVVTYDNSSVEVTDYCTTIPVVLTLSLNTVEVPAEGGEQELTATFTNFTAEDLNSPVTFARRYASADATGTIDPNPLYNWVKSVEFDNGTRKLTFTFEPNKTGATRTAYFKLRLVFCTVYGEIESDMLTITQEAMASTVTIAEACTDGTKYYGTYSNTSAFILPEGVTASEISVINGELVVEDYAGAIVPANTGVMISSATAGEKTFYLTTGGESVLGQDNMLRPTGEGITADAMAEEDPACMYYRLTMHNGSQIGFWWGAADGAAFAVAANKAYLAVPMNEAKNGFAFGNDGDATEIVLNALKGEQNGEMYNLQGQKVGSEYKGIVIVNGKAYINK